MDDKSKTKNELELFLAAMNSDIEKVSSLLEVGANVNLKDSDGNTPLHWAIKNGNLKIIELLVSKGANNEIKNQLNKTPLDLAQDIDRQDIISLLKKDDNQNARIETKENILFTTAQLDSEKRINGVHGSVYQLKLLMLFLYRGISQKYSFYLGTEVKEAKKFDDLVFAYIQDNKKIYRLLQAKHKLDESKKITIDSLLNVQNGDYSLVKYFYSYQDSKREKIFKEGYIKDVIICTNIDFDFESLKNAHIELVKVKDEDDILNVKSYKKLPSRYKFKKSITPLLKEKLQNQKKSKFNYNLSDDEIQDFLDHFIFAVNQPNEEELGKIVKDEIGEEFDTITTENVYNKFFMMMLNWLQGKQKDTFFSSEEGNAFFNEVRKGIPIRFDIRNPVDSFVGRIKVLHDVHKKLLEDTKNADLQIICVSGLRGVGKSELIKKYINLYSSEYDNKVVWISAENFQNLSNSFHRLARDVLKISTKNANDEEKDIVSIIEDVYKFFSKGKSLFIFDSAVQYKNNTELDNGIKKFLPSLPAHLKKPYIIITSQIRKWPSYIKVIPLESFSLDEAKNLVQKSLNLTDDLQTKEIEELANEVHFFPLALQQAIAYIRSEDKKLKNVKSEFNIAAYLKRYRETARQLLDFTFPDDFDNDYDKTVLSTWSITLKAINSEKNAQDALNILYILSYFSPENISVLMMLNLLSNQEKLSCAIEVLEKFSMVNVENEMLYIHGLVQKVVRLHVRKQNMEIKVLKQALKLFNKENIVLCLNHALSVGHYAVNYNELIHEFSILTCWMSGVLMDEGRYGEAFTLNKMVLKKLESISADSPFSVEGCLATKNHLGMALLKLGKYNDALKILSEVLSIQQQNLPSDNPTLLSVKSNIALALDHLGKYKEAQIHLQEIFEIEKKMLDINDPEYLSTKFNLATIYVKLERLDEALEMLQDIYKIQINTLGENDLKTLNTKNSLAGLFASQYKYNKALKMYKEILNIQEVTLRKNHPDIISSKKNIAPLLVHEGKLDNAMKIYQEVLNSEMEVYEENHPDVLASQFGIAQILRAQSKYDEALKICREIVPKQKNILGLNHPDVLNSQYLEAVILANMEKIEESLIILQDILNRQMEIFGPDNSSTLNTKKVIASMCSKLGNHDQALNLNEEIYKAQEKNLSENHIDILKRKNEIGMALLFKKKYDKALQVFEEVVNKMAELYPNNPLIISSLNNKATALSGLGMHDEALDDLQRALAAQKSILGPEHFDTFKTKYNIAEVLLHKMESLKALKIYKEIVKEFSQVLGPEHPKTLKIIKFIQSMSKVADDLFSVVKNGKIEVIKMGLENGLDVNTVDSENKSLLHYSVDKGNVDITNFLLQHGADPLLITLKGNTALHIASLRGHHSMVKILLEHVKRNFNDKLNDFINTKTFAKSTTALHVAAKKGHLEIVITLLVYSANFNAKDKDGKTPLDLVKENLKNNSKNNNLQKIISIFENRSKTVGFIKK